jgi:hypothetical protein
MTEFIRICPKCKQENPEYEHVCAGCGQFIALEAAIPRPPVPAKIDPPPAAPVETSPPPSPAKPVPAATRRMDTAESFYLQHGERIFTVKHGWVMGQAHPQNTAQIQIPLDIAGCEFIHRRHCRFILKDRQWHAQALDQKRFQRDFTNPTLVNRKALKADGGHRLQNGDVLTLAGVDFVVKMV